MPGCVNSESLIRVRVNPGIHMLDNPLVQTILLFLAFFLTISLMGFLFTIGSENCLWTPMRETGLILHAWSLAGILLFLGLIGLVLLGCLWTDVIL